MATVGRPYRIIPSGRSIRLTRNELLALSEQARALEALTGAPVEIDLRNHDCASMEFGGINNVDIAWKRLIFGRAGSEESAILRGASFHGASLDWCEFVDTDLDHVSFRGSTISNCDFRYATFQQAHLTEATFRLCDFYGANMCRGTEMQRVEFSLVSPPDYYDGVTGLRWSTFSGRKPPSVVAESRRQYEEFLRRTQDQRPSGRPIDAAMKERLENAAGSFRTLSAYWDRRGQYDDAGKAYAYSQRLLRRSLSPWRRETKTRVLRWLGLWAADLICGFGENLWRIAMMLICIALLPGVAFFLLSDVSGSRGIGDDLLFSAAHLTPATPQGLSAANRPTEVIGICQMIIGVALLGLFGFVLGNRIRRS